MDAITTRTVVTHVRRQTLADFCALPEGTLAQFIDGQILMSPAPSSPHQRVVMRFAHALNTLVLERDLGEVFVAPFDVYLSETLVVQPDVVFVSHERAGRVAREGLRGAPDLVAEVLSPSTAYYDLTVKREAYARHGVAEYWLIDPERETVEVLVPGPEGYRAHTSLRGEGRAASALLEGFAVDVGSLFASPLGR